MTVEWFDRGPGDTVAQGDAEHEGDGKMLLIGTDRPDWVRLPASLGGGQVRVRSSDRQACPAHKDHECLHHHLENGVSVAECDQFYWYTPRSR